MTGVFDQIAEILEAVVLPVHAEAGEARDAVGPTGTDSAVESSTLLLYAPTRTAGQESAPLMEVHLSRQGAGLRLSVVSGVGIIEWNMLNEVRLLESTGEVAFVRHDSESRISLLTLSSRGVIQVYAYLDRSLLTLDLADVPEDDLRSAVALKMFLEQGSETAF